MHALFLHIALCTLRLSSSSPTSIPALAEFVLTALDSSSVGVSFQDDAAVIFPPVFNPWIQPRL